MLTAEPAKITPQQSRAERARRNLARRHLGDYYRTTVRTHVPGAWQLDLCARLERFALRVERKEGPRMIVLAPPQHGKSTIVSRAFPAWVLGRFPDWSLILASYAESLAAGHGRWIRNTLESEWHRILFPKCELAPDSAAVDQMSTTLGGQLIARGVGGGTTGNPARIFITDDPFADREQADSETMREKVWDWYGAVATTRLAPGGGDLIMHTRWHEEDLVGKVLEKAKEEGDLGDIEVVSYPAIAEEDDSFRRKGEALHPERYDLAELEKKRRKLTSRDWLSLYQQKPKSDEGGYFKAAWMRTYNVAPPTGEVAIAADFAYRTKESNDYTCAFPFGLSESSDLVFLPQGFCERLETDQSVERLLDMAEQTGAGTLICGRDALQSIGPFMRKRMEERNISLTLVEMPEKSDKEARARSLQARSQSGKVLWPAGRLFEEMIEPMLLAFPAGKHDDPVDMGSNACYLLDWAPEYRPAKPKPRENPDKKRWDEIDRRKKRDTPGLIKPLFGG